MIRFRFRFRAASVLLLAVVAVGCNGDDRANPDPPAAQGPRQALSVPDAASTAFTGRGNTTTTSFRVSDHWTLHWDHTRGAPIQIELIAAGGERIGLVDEQGKNPARAGVVGRDDSGRYRLRIQTDGRWAVGIVEK